LIKAAKIIITGLAKTSASEAIVTFITRREYSVRWADADPDGEWL